MTVVYFIRLWCASELVAHIKQWFGKRQVKTTALTRCTTNTSEDCALHRVIPSGNPHACWLRVALPQMLGQGFHLPPRRFYTCESKVLTDSLLLRFTSAAQTLNGCLITLALTLLLGQSKVWYPCPQQQNNCPHYSKTHVS